MTPFKDTVFLNETDVSGYPTAPFDPPKAYPEWEGPIDPSNQIYAHVRDLLRSFEFDKEKEETADWNPLRGFVTPGQTVVIKPNLVFHKHPSGEEGIQSMVTHGSVLRPIVDYVWRALEGNGRIVIGDVPLQAADWEAIMEATGIQKMVDHLRETKAMNLELYDLRLEHVHINSLGVITKRKQHHGDPHGYVPVDIGKDSMLMPIIDQHKNFSITDYPDGTVSKHHNPEVNEYLVPQTILEADVFINVPKLKTHKKAGVTLSMKNLIGINGDKSWIAHHRKGAVDKGGDEFNKIQTMDLIKYRVFTGLKNNRVGVYLLSAMLWGLRGVAKLQQRVRPKSKTVMQMASITEGSWYGNDTLWRVILDLNRIIHYADRKGKMKDEMQRKYLTIIDGIWGGERNGPMHHMVKKANVLFGGFNPISTDLVAAHWMGFDYEKIPKLKNAWTVQTFPLIKTHADDIKVVRVANSPHAVPFKTWKTRPTRAFLAATSWEGHIEHEYRNQDDQTTDIPQFLEIGGE